MKSILKPLLLSIALAGASVSMVAIAQTPGTGMMAHSGGQDHGRMDPAKMQQRMAAHMAELKAKLKLTGAQEEGWTQFVAAMKPPAGAGQKMGREDHKKMHEEMQKLTTPQRIERMNAMKAQRDGEMTKRHEATLTFYRTLSAEQQQVFDANAMGGHRGGGRGGNQRKHG
jgi:hypothetical protein